MIDLLETFDPIDLAQELTPFTNQEKRKSLNGSHFSGTENLYGLVNAIKNRVKTKYSYQKLWKEDVFELERNRSCITTGFRSIDNITSDLQKSDLVVVAARPSMGKTAFVLSMATNISRSEGVPVAIFSLGMSTLQLATRLIVSETVLPLEKIKTGEFECREWTRFAFLIRELENMKIFIDDTPAISISELRSKCRKLVEKEGVQVIIIDYLQLISAGGNVKMDTREQEINYISKELKAIAKELDVPVIAISQLNRANEKDGENNKPVLSDLSVYGAIEQVADKVLFIHRPEYYGITEDEAGNSLKGIAEIIIAKNTNGELGEVRLRFHDKWAKFEEISEKISMYDEDYWS